VLHTSDDVIWRQIQRPIDGTNCASDERLLTLKVPDTKPYHLTFTHMHSTKCSSDTVCSGLVVARDKRGHTVQYKRKNTKHGGFVHLPAGDLGEAVLGDTDLVRSMAAATEPRARVATDRDRLGFLFSVGGAASSSREIAWFKSVMADVD